MEEQFDGIDQDMMFLYEWVDSVALSRPKKNINRDFSDGVLLAEMIKHHAPSLVELHNYPTAFSMKHKNTNWNTLNQKVFRKLGFQLTNSEIDEVVQCHPGAIESILKQIYLKLFKFNDRAILSKENSGIYESIKAKKENSNYINYKDLLLQKDMIINELKSSLEVIIFKLDYEFELHNNDEEICHLRQKIEILKDAINNSGK